MSNLNRLQELKEMVTSVDEAIKPENDNEYVTVSKINVGRGGTQTVHVKSIALDDDGQEIDYEFYCNNKLIATGSGTPDGPDTLKIKNQMLVGTLLYAAFGQEGKLTLHSKAV